MNRNYNFDTPFGTRFDEVYCYRVAIYKGIYYVNFGNYKALTTYYVLVSFDYGKQGEGYHRRDDHGGC